MEPNQLLIFDLDDTLVDTSHVYWVARTRFIEELAAVGIDLKVALEIFETTDSDMIKIWGHAPERYGQSMIASVERIFNSLHRSIPDQLLARILSHGQIILEQLPQPLEGAADLLDWASTRFKLALITRGIDDLQTRKLQHTGFHRYFDIVRIVPAKNAGTFTRVIEEAGFSPEVTWVIGDSIKSDINPGIEVGAKCIFYLYKHPEYHWQQEHGAIAQGSFYKVESLSDVKQILLSPTSFDRVFEI